VGQTRQISTLANLLHPKPPVSRHALP
jgi:hypothetical protein